MHRDGPRPNLFIIGSAKSGTTSLHHYLSTHPDVFMCEPKEPGFFVPEMTYYPKEESWYRSIFAGAGDARVVGESSTHYSKLPTYAGVPERIAAYSPDARFIYLMRDPIKRAISHYWHNIRQYEERKDILHAMKTEVPYTAYGDYRMQLEPYFRLFGRERVLLLTFEELVRRPRDVVERTFAWLGVDVNGGTRTFSKENARPEEVRKIQGLGMLRRFATSGVWDRLNPLAPSWVKNVGKQMAMAPVKPDEVPTDEVVDYLRPLYRPRVEELEGWLGMEFPQWTTVFPERAARREPAAAGV